LEVELLENRDMLGSLLIAYPSLNNGPVPPGEGNDLLQDQVNIAHESSLAPFVFSSGDSEAISTQVPASILKILNTSAATYDARTDTYFPGFPGQQETPLDNGEFEFGRAFAFAADVLVLPFDENQVIDGHIPRTAPHTSFADSQSPVAQRDVSANSASASLSSGQSGGAAFSWGNSSGALNGNSLTGSIFDERTLSAGVSSAFDSRTFGGLQTGLSSPKQTDTIDPAPKGLRSSSGPAGKPHGPLAPAPTGIWPVQGANSHQMLQGFGDGSPQNIYKFHDGIDITAGGNGGETVVASRGGTVIWNNPNYSGGMVTIKVTLADGTVEYDRYLHVENIVAPAEGQAIASGAQIGAISTTYHDAGSRHLHFNVHNAQPPRDAAPAENTFLNPFLRFAAAADQDPLQQSPTLQNTINDPLNRQILVTASGTWTSVGSFAFGSVDIIADARDPMGTFLGASGVNNIGYYIKALYNQNVPYHNVKSLGAQYVLAKFDDSWFPARPYTNGKFSLVYADDGIVDMTHPKTGELRVNPNNTQFAMTKNYIVTNTKGTDGTVANVVDQYWRTNAKDDGASDTSTHANYAGNYQTTFNNGNARFKDGWYEIHIVEGDLLISVDKIPGKVLVANFSRTPMILASAGTIPTGTPAIVYDPNNATPATPDFQPTAVIALTSPGSFTIGTPVSIADGPFYFPNLLMHVYILPHKDAGWNQGDDIASGAYVQALVQAGADGRLNATQIWQPTFLGHFDVVVDYDNDGKFSWKLDGINSFVVQ
jgi:hypothetical protein